MRLIVRERLERKREAVVGWWGVACQGSACVFQLTFLPFLIVPVVIDPRVGPAGLAVHRAGGAVVTVSALVWGAALIWNLAIPISFVAAFACLFMSGLEVNGAIRVRKQTTERARRIAMPLIWLTSHLPLAIIVLLPLFCAGLIPIRSFPTASNQGTTNGTGP